MIDSRFFDSSAWLSYFYAFNDDVRSMVESNILILTSVLSLFEIKNKLIKDKTDIIKMQKSIEFIKKRGLIIDLNSEIAENAVEFSTSYGLHAMDALIYSSALKNNSLLITLDNDFRGLNNTVIIKDAKK